MAETETRPHSYKRAPAQEVWIKTPWFCWSCGQQALWQSLEAGEDYYYGCSAICKACGRETLCMDKYREGGPTS